MSHEGDVSAGLGRDGYQSAQGVRSTVHVKPDAVVEVALPQTDENAGAFGQPGLLDQDSSEAAAL